MEVYQLNLKKLVAESKRLKEAYSAMGAMKEENASAGKFSVIKANSGSVDNDFKGLGRSVGAPNSNDEFATSNCKFTTTPQLEWNITVNGHDCPKENRVHTRKIRLLSEVMKVSLVLKAKLIEEEVISIVLYTGPMVFARIIQTLFSS